MAVEAQVDSWMSDLELLYQEQLKSIVEDLAEHQAAERKGKAVATDPPLQEDHASIMVLEEDSAVPDSPRPDELITLQPEGGSRWFVQHMPHSDSVASGSAQISRQSGIPSTSTLENAEEESLAVQAANEPTEQKAASVTELSAASEVGPLAVSLTELAGPSAASVA